MGTELGVIMGQSITPALLLVALGLVVLGFVIGAIGSGGGRQTKPTAKTNPSQAAFLRGVSYLMADHTDQAIEEFSKSVQLNSDTLETYVVLGNLFRQKGEIERAVRIRHNIIARPNLDPKFKLQATFDLGLDYRYGGLFNRAVESFLEVLESDPAHLDTYTQLTSLYEEMGEWEKAFEARKKLDKLSGVDSRAIMAHYKYEQAAELFAAGETAGAEEALRRALKVDKSCFEASLFLGKIELSKGRARKALSLWRKAMKSRPELAHLIVDEACAGSEKLGEKNLHKFLAEVEQSDCGAAAFMKMASYFRQQGDDGKALELVQKALVKSPGLLEAHRMKGRMLLEKGEKTEAVEAFGDMLDNMTETVSGYYCDQCGFTCGDHAWKYPKCQQWDSLVLVAE